jgi:hypothetical protein
MGMAAGAAAAAAAANPAAIRLLSRLDGASLARVWDDQNQELVQFEQRHRCWTTRHTEG